MLASLAEALRVLSVLLSPYIPEGSAKALEALGSPDLSLAGARLRQAHAGAPGRGTPAAVPQALTAGSSGDDRRQAVGGVDQLVELGGELRSRGTVVGHQRVVIGAQVGQ